MTGFSNKERCVSRGKFLSASRSASSAKLLDVRIKVVRFGIEFASVACMLLSRLRARSRVRRRSESGKLARAVMSLSVKSMASWSYSMNYFSAAMSQYSVRTRRESRGNGGKEGEGKEKTDLGHA